MRFVLPLAVAFAAAGCSNLRVYLKTFAGSGPDRRLITKPGYSYVNAGTRNYPNNAFNESDASDLER
jgi:hypothetical protein